MGCYCSVCVSVVRCFYVGQTVVASPVVVAWNNLFEDFVYLLVLEYCSLALQSHDLANMLGIMGLRPGRGPGRGPQLLFELYVAFLFGHLTIH